MPAANSHSSLGIGEQGARLPALVPWQQAGWPLAPQLTTPLLSLQTRFALLISCRPVNVKTEIWGNLGNPFHASSELPLATEEVNEGWRWRPELPLSAGSQTSLTFPQLSPFFPPLSQSDLILLNLLLVPLASWIFFFFFLFSSPPLIFF